jgi:DNA-binding beta-propeller fold protein YncE
MKLCSHRRLGSFVSLGGVLGLTLLFAAPRRLTAQTYRVTDTVPIPGKGNYDYLLADTKARRLYATLDQAVILVDLNSMKPVGKIDVGGFVHGVALVPELGKGFISDGEWPGANKSPDEVVSFDLKTSKIQNRIKVGTNPDCIIYDPASHKVFAFNHGADNSVNVIDPKTEKVEKTLDLGGPPEYAVSNGAGHVFVNIEEPAQLVDIDTAKMAVTAHWSLGSCKGPAALAINSSGSRLFSMCFNKMMMVVDAHTGHVVAKLPIGSGVDGAGYDPQEKQIFAPSFDGTLTIVQEKTPDSYAVVQNLRTAPGARVMAMDLRTGKIILATSRLGATPPGSEFPHIIPGTYQLLVVQDH